MSIFLCLTCHVSCFCYACFYHVFFSSVYHVSIKFLWCFYHVFFSCFYHVSMMFPESSVKLCGCSPLLLLVGTCNWIMCFRINYCRGDPSAYCLFLVFTAYFRPGHNFQTRRQILKLFGSNSFFLTHRLFR